MPEAVVDHPTAMSNCAPVEVALWIRSSSTFPSLRKMANPTDPDEDRCGEIEYQSAPTIGVSNPALLASLTQPRPWTVNPQGVRVSCDLFGCAAEVTAAGSGSNGRHRAGIGPANGWSLTCLISASSSAVSPSKAQLITNSAARTSSGFGRAPTSMHRNAVRRAAGSMRSSATGRSTYCATENARI
jgi:hypothetical protein